MGALIAQHAWNESHDGLCNYQRRYFPTDQHIITDGYLADAVATRGIIHHALIDSLITPASKDDVLLIRPRTRICLTKRFSRWGRHNEQWEVTILLGLGVDRIGVRLYSFKLIVAGTVQVRKGRF